jgi:hypothetical protein
LEVLELEVLFLGLEASPVAWISFMDPDPLWIRIETNAHPNHCHGHPSLF